MVESRRKSLKTRKTAKGAALLSFFHTTNNPSCAKSLLEGLTMLFKPPDLLTTSFPTLSTLKQSGMSLKKIIFILLSRKNALYSNSDIDKTALNLPNTIKIGQWRTGKGSYGQMRPRLIGLGQMEGSTLERRKENPFQIGLPPLLSNMEESFEKLGIPEENRIFQ